MIPPPPRSTLFPYTTLFRSNSAVGDRRYNSIILWDDTFVRYNEPHIGKAAVKVLEALGLKVSLARARRCCGRPADRKSTRLNSSHVSISYAVFCLKKKRRKK